MKHIDDQTRKPQADKPLEDDRSEELAAKRREELHRLKEQLAGENRLKGNAEQLDPGEHQKDEELRSFVEALAERKKKKKHQLQIIKDLFEDPIRFGLQTEFIPSSTSIEEIEQRKKELRYRMDLLRTMLEMMESEMELLSRGQTPTTEGDHKSDG